MPEGHRGYVWKQDAGKSILFCAIATVVICQLLIPIFEIKVPIAAPNLYVILVAVLVIWHGAVTKGWKRSIFGFFVLLLVGFVMEGLGVNYGLVYGPYHYNDLMGPRIFGVPLLVPVSWELNMYPAFYLALYLMPTEIKSKSIKSWQKAVFVLLLATLGAFICTFYDLIADPVYCFTAEAWVWHNPGDFAPWVWGGIPISNYMGWILTGIVGCILYYLILDSTPSERHTKSNYLVVWVPLTIYIGALIMPMFVNAVYIKNDSLIMYGLFGMGFVILMVVAKCIFSKLGYAYVEPNNQHSYRP